MRTISPTGRAVPVVLCGGHESAHGEGLRQLAGSVAAEAPVRVASPGSGLARALAEALAQRTRPGPVVVLPMTLGRDPRLVADTARTVRWATRDCPDEVALAPPFGSADHLVGWLRAACRQLDEQTAALIAAAPAGPFDDAELHRIAALVRANAGRQLVEVGIRTSSGCLFAGLDRCRRLGARRVAIIPAELRERPDASLPLLSPATIDAVVAARVRTALHHLAAHGDDGVATALASDHLHAFAHSHEEGHSHPHDHHHPPHDVQAAVG